MIYTLTLNPSIDIIARVRELKRGGLNRITKEERFPGGKGVNVSIVLHNLGVESIALGFAAGRTGSEIEDMLAQEEVRTDFVHLPGESRINMKLGEISDGKQLETQINGVGPKICDEDRDKLLTRLDSLQEGDILVMAGSVPDSLPSDFYMVIMDRLSDRKIKFVVDATGDNLKNVLSRKPFLIKPNNLELGELFGVDIDCRDTAKLYGKKLRDLGAENVLISMGEKGAVLICRDGTVIEEDAPKGEVINTIGAGDSMVAGFLAGLQYEDNMYAAFAWGLCAGSASAFSQSLASKEQVAKLMKKNAYMDMSKNE